MKNVNRIPYSPPVLEIIALDCNDIITTSGEYESDDNVLENW